MALDTEVNKILKDNPMLEQYVSGNKDLEDKLYGIVGRSYEQNEYLIKGARWVDSVKRWSNLVKLPIDIVFGSIPVIGDAIAYPIRGIATALEAIIELPYMAYYVGKTKGTYLKPLYGWIARAGLQYLPSVPGTIGDVAGLIPLYEMGVKAYMRNAAAKQMIDYLKDQGIIKEDIEEVKHPKHKPKFEPEPAFQPG